jgi:hypothetical protein
MTDRLKTLETMLMMIDLPNEGEEIKFSLIEEPNIKYRGFIKKKVTTDGQTIFKIISATKPTPSGIIDMIWYKDRKFKNNPKK